MSFNTILEKKIRAKISESTVLNPCACYVHVEVKGKCSALDTSNLAIYMYSHETSQDKPEA